MLKCRRWNDRFLERGGSFDLDVLHCDWDAPAVRSQLSSIAQFLGVVSRNPDIVKSGGDSVDVVKTLDRSPISNVGVYYPFNTFILKLEKC